MPWGLTVLELTPRPESARASPTVDRPAHTNPHSLKAFSSRRVEGPSHSGARAGGRRWARVQAAAARERLLEKPRGERRPFPPPGGRVRTMELMRTRFPVRPACARTFPPDPEPGLATEHDRFDDRCEQMSRTHHAVVAPPSPSVARPYRRLALQMRPAICVRNRPRFI